jgi:hypothetical protein
MPEVSKKWGQLCGQEFAIVKIKDVRGNDYLQEICKYVVKSDELAKWEGEMINEFCQAVRGVRLFTSFGSMRDLAPQIRAELAAEKPDGPICDCGCTKFIYEDETTALLETVRQAERHASHRKQANSNAVAAGPELRSDYATPELI